MLGQPILGQSETKAASKQKTIWSSKQHKAILSNQAIYVTE